MEGIKKFITCHVPVSACNFRCMYCYIGQINENKGKIVSFASSSDRLAARLSPERLGGYCYFNLCGNGETMMHPQLSSFVYELTGMGHYVDIITNGTLVKKFDELIQKLDPDRQSHLFIKFSFHYLELKRTGLMNKFLENVEKIKESGISYTIEITPHDELVSYIDEIKTFSIRHFGAFPHITVARNEATKEIELLTKLSRDEYKETWGQFDSRLFDFKFSIFNQPRCEFCYAGLWSLEVDLATGNYIQCYRGKKLGNLLNNKPIIFAPIGKCNLPHCFNGHAFLAYGDIPELPAPTYKEERDRVTINGEHWLKEGCQKFFSTKLYENNEELSDEQKSKTIKLTNRYNLKRKLKDRIKRGINE